MDEVQRNIIYFSIIGIGLLTISLIFFYKIFDELRFYILIVAFQTFIVSLPFPDLNLFIFLNQTDLLEIYAFIFSLTGIILLSGSTFYLLRKDFDWQEPWMRYGLVSLIISIIFSAIGLGIIAFKRQLVSMYMLLTRALQTAGWLGYLFAPYNIIDAIIMISIGIGAIISLFINISRYPSYH